MTRNSVLLLASSGYIVRDLLLGKFAEVITKHVDLVAAVPDPQDTGLLGLIQGKPIRLIKFQSNSAKTPIIRRYFKPQMWLYRFKQKERNNTSLKIVTRLAEPNLRGKKKLAAEFMHLIGSGVVNLGLIGLVEDMFLYSISHEKIVKQWESILENVKPSAIVSTMLTLPANYHTPSIDMPVILAARRMNIPVGTLIQSWDNLSSKTYVLPPQLNKYWTWSSEMSEELISLNPRIHSSKVHIVGSPHFDFHIDLDLYEKREIFLPKIRVNPEKPYVLIGTGTRKWLPNEPDTVLRLVERIKANIPDLQVLLRMHPKDEGSRWKGISHELEELDVLIQWTAPQTEMDKGGFTPPKTFFFEQINSIRHAAVVINTASSLTVDAAILDRPIISIGYDTIPDSRFPEGRAWMYNNSVHFKVLVATGGVWVVRSEEECLQAIQTYMAKPFLHETARRQIAQKVIGPIDGNAGLRLADEVFALIKKT